jgi:hypothetical protein
MRRSFELSVKGDIVHDKKLAVHVTLAIFALFEVIFGAFLIEYERYV